MTAKLLATLPFQFLGLTSLATVLAGVLHPRARVWLDEEEPWWGLNISTKSDPPAKPWDTRCSFTIAISIQSAPLK